MKIYDNSTPKGRDLGPTRAYILINYTGKEQVGNKPMIAPKPIRDKKREIDSIKDQIRRLKKIAQEASA